MNEQPQFPQGFVPMPFGYPPASVVQQRGDEPPARILVALRFLHELNMKTATVPAAAPQGMTVEEVKGQTLTRHETRAQEAACDLLADYFQGILDPNQWEGALLGLHLHRDEASARVVPCPRCTELATRTGQAKDCSCHLCRGYGYVSIAPSGPPGERKDT